jgi:hypothetical protein
VKDKRILIALTLITSLISTPQAFPAGKSSIVIKKAGRSSTSIPNTILSGNGIPAKTVGIDGDFYIDIKNANFYGPKAKGVWKLPTSLRVVSTKESVAPVSGSDGAKGNSGEQGLTGATGAKGADGIAGAKGADGAKGATGLTGAPGSIGAVGATGSAGAKGEIGLPGTNGTAGTNGTPGTNGVAGIDGALGTNGTNGTDGVDGAPGANGSDGSNGAAGISNAYWVALPSSTLLTDIAGRKVVIASSFTLSVNSSYIFEVMINGLIPLNNVENLFIGAYIDLCVDLVCTPISNQYSIASNSESNANGAKSKQFGIRIIGAYSNVGASPVFKVRVIIQSEAISVSSINFSGNALITKVGSIG